MKATRILSILIVLVMCFSSVSVFADAGGELLIMPSPATSDAIKVNFNGEPMVFDVNPVVENQRTLVPFRAIFERMGCVVDYFTSQDGRHVVTANRGYDLLMLTIGEKEMYFRDEKIELDVPAKIENDRTLVPLRAITEAFECEVVWTQDTHTVDIFTPACDFIIKPHKLEKSVVDADGAPLVNAVIYYPVIDNTRQIPFVDELNHEFKWLADKFIADAESYKEEAAMLRQQMGDSFVPYELEQTFEDIYNIYGTLNIKTYTYSYFGGAHPNTVTESRVFGIGMEMEYALADILDENAMGTTLRELVTALFAPKLQELGMIPGEDGVYQELETGMGNLQYDLNPRSVTLYFNQGEVAPYAAGIISADIPYSSTVFLVDMDTNLIDKHTYELENDKGYEWIVVDYSKDKLTVTEEYTAYDPETLLSEYYPVGMKRITITPKAEGNAQLTLACVEKGKSINEAQSVIVPVYNINDSNEMTLVTELEQDKKWYE